MSYLSSTEVSTIRSLAAESAFSLNHRTDLPPRPKTTDPNHQGPRARIFTCGPHTKAPTNDPAPSSTEPAPLPAPKGKHHRPPTPATTPADEPAPAPVTEEPGYTVIDLRYRRVRWQHTPTHTDQHHQHDQHSQHDQYGHGILIDLDAYRAQALARSRPPTPPRTPLRQPDPHPRRRSTRVRRYTHDLNPDDRAEFATLRNTIRRYLNQPHTPTQDPNPSTNPSTNPTPNKGVA
ncbi:hypothetical protein [Nocardiopsis alkaliphila]|uniref:hypothetical protein n=1 Tax=Nocardiopsis alkaliphila TaxID=225762 RepID=UPI00034B1812|nr:hypothetical protein [Nocardiopsis alkaliphila]